MSIYFLFVVFVFSLGMRVVSAFLGGRKHEILFARVSTSPTWKSTLFLNGISALRQELHISNYMLDWILRIEIAHLTCELFPKNIRLFLFSFALFFFPC